MGGVTPFYDYALCLVAGLVLAAAVSAAITWHLRRRELRREHVLVLMQALTRYADWLAAQRGGAGLSPHRELADRALLAASRAQGRWFPQLRADLSRLLEADGQLESFVYRQQQLRMSDPEAWLESNHESRFAHLLRQQDKGVERLLRRLEGATDQPGATSMA